uniref:Uncharacterized protein n=1 Tax=Solanum lycopersicum TaxID=4081 RepID=A0A3Q7I444_SOLLC
MFHIVLEGTNHFCTFFHRQIQEQLKVPLFLFSSKPDFLALFSSILQFYCLLNNIFRNQDVLEFVSMYSQFDIEQDQMNIDNTT